MDLVSIIMPAYNAEKYIEEAIISVLKQTYPNFELVIVNDGSTDNTGNIISEYRDKFYDKIVYIDKKVNEGTALTLNRAIREARGKYICWLSADDVFFEDTVESLVKFLEDHKEYDIIFSDYELIDNNSIFLRESFFKRAIIELVDNNLNQPYRGLLMEGCIINGCSIIVPKKCFEEAGDFNHQYRYAHDYDLWLRLASRYSIGYLNKINVKNRTYREQISQQGHNEVDALHVLFDFFEKHELRNALFEKAGIPKDMDGIFTILNKLLSVYKHKEEEFKALHKLALICLIRHEKAYGKVVKNENVTSFKIKCKLIGNNQPIKCDSFFSDGHKYNYFYYLCRYLNLNGFIINHQAIRFDRFEGNTINRLNQGLMRNNTIVICHLNRDRFQEILQERKSDFKYYSDNNQSQELRIGITYYMLYDSSYKTLFEKSEKIITDYDMWGSLMDAIIKENLVCIKG